ncbi:hypothetical protein RchiOBHm_Chr2g0167431 [Rosa chinensis]|uniref:Uncharacterized protein n=1 Tax=Rosa chinensis TaxID=74649 RepID=A0A2P6S4B5_ROSCH|nr:hypothetical protein RchiOBHm_Chr2g0167431 [Rosa chinensis]
MKKSYQSTKTVRSYCIWKLNQGTTFMVKRVDDFTGHSHHPMYLEFLQKIFMYFELNCFSLKKKSIHIVKRPEHSKLLPIDCVFFEVMDEK